MQLRLPRLARMIREKGEGERAVGTAGSSWGSGVTSGLAGFALLECAVGPVSGAGLGGCWAPPIGLRQAP
eukprot:9133934-Heterocapsa_arctica.AAC.1